MRPEFLDGSTTDAAADGTSKRSDDAETSVPHSNVGVASATSFAPPSNNASALERLPEAMRAVVAMPAPAAQTTTHTTVLDPFAFLTTLARPLVSVKDAYVRFVTGTSSPSASRDVITADASTDSDAEAAVEPLSELEREASIIERSFASEFASLLGSPPVPPRTAGDAARTRTNDAATQGSANDAAVAATEAEPDAYEHRIHLPPMPRAERAIPLTRLPLRTQEREIAWTRDSDAAGPGVTPTREQRHALLERCVRDASTLSGAVLERAYREEDLTGRMLALHALVRRQPPEGRDIFVEALRLGSDEERALAIDGLAKIEARAELVTAFGDRVDAVAAKAALAYVGSRSRSDYRTELAPYVDAAQIDKILTLLAGIVE